MEPHIRYQIIDTIAQGDFATVFRARDNELGREVAIKQIHQQYLADPKKLERYWQEAQLLANLEHPYVMSIYDIVRQRGWLILELMQGSLQQKLNGQPIDLEDLRLTLTYMLHGLHFLQQNGIVHGDVKPSNLLLDKNHRVKLGDFGIARRLAGDDGSVIKGTTKYMAPEVVSDQFGPVGPQSDLYSLGFSAYELMAGSHFDTLFPSLNMFGRDPQLAWIMWHSTADQRLPEINRVLQGVPEDLAHVIQKLTQKNPADRYPSAEKALLELRAGGNGGDDTLTAEEKAQLASVGKKQKQKRMMLIGAVCVSFVMSFFMLFADVIFPKPKPKPPAVVVEPSEGVITFVNNEDNSLEVDPATGEEIFLVKVSVENDRIIVNQKVASLGELTKGDRIKINRLKSQDGKKFNEIVATRQTGSTTTSEIASMDARQSVVTLKATGDDGKPITLYVPLSVSISLNGSSKSNGKVVTLADLKPNDRVVVEHVPGAKLPLATTLTALRVVSAGGRLESIDASNRTIRMRDDQLPGAAPREFTVADDCQLTLNGESVLSGGKAVTLSDLKASDTIQIQHDDKVVRIDAQRQFSSSGTVTDVKLDPPQVSVDIPGKASPVMFSLAKDCSIKLSPSDIDIDLDFVETGDSVSIAHMSANLVDAEANMLTVTAKSKPDRWALVIGQQAYDDSRVPALTHSASDAELVRDTLATYYRVPADQLQLELDATRAKLEQSLPKFLQRVAPSTQLLVYFVGHGYFDEGKQPVLATKEFRMAAMAQTGLPLAWLIKEIEKSTAAEKILLLDTCHAGKTSDGIEQPSVFDFASSLKSGTTRPVSTSVHVLAGCTPKQKGLTLRESKQGLFASAISQGMRGEADANEDRAIDVDELHAYLETRMAALSAKTGGIQSPFRFIPDPNPPRLLTETKEAVKRLLGYMQAPRFENEITVLYNAARQLQPDQPDVAMAYALVMSKHFRTKEAQDVFESLRAAHPDELLPYHALSWQYLMQKNCQDGVRDLIELSKRLPDPDPDRGYDPYVLHLLNLSGKMGMFSFQAAERPLTSDEVKALTVAVSLRGKLARDTYSAGVAHVREAMQALDDQIVIERDKEKRDTLERNRKLLSFYADFGFDLAVEYLLRRLEQ